MKKTSVATAAAIVLLVGLTSCSSLGGGVAARVTRTSQPSAAQSPAAPSPTAEGRPLVTTLIKNALTKMERASTVTLSLSVVEDKKAIKYSYSGLVDGQNGTIVYTVDGKGPATVIISRGAAFYVVDKGLAAASGQELDEDKYGMYITADRKELDSALPKKIFADIKEEWQRVGLLDNLTSVVEEGTLEGKPVWVATDRVNPLGVKVYFAKNATFDFLGVQAQKPSPVTMWLSSWDNVKLPAHPPADKILK